MITNNNVRQLFVADGTYGTSHLVAEGSSKSSKGDISFIKPDLGNYVYLEHMGVDGIVRTDTIDLDKINYLSIKTSNELRTPLKRYKVSMKEIATLSDGGVIHPISGQDYAISVCVNGFIAKSPRHTYEENGIAHAYRSTTVAQLLGELAWSLYKNMSQDYFNVYYETGGTKKDTAGTLKIIDKSVSESTVTSAAVTGIVIEEKEQSWRRGVKPFDSIDFYVRSSSIKDETNDEFNWAYCEKLTPVNYVEDGKKIADLEWQAMGNRGDIYRGQGYPMNFETEYLVDPTKKYGTLDISYYWSDHGNHPQKSEKTLTIVSTKQATLTSIKTAIENAIKPSTANTTSAGS